MHVFLLLYYYYYDELRKTVSVTRNIYIPEPGDIILYAYPSELGFPTGRDSATFRDNRTEVPSLSRDKGTTGQAKNLAKGRDGPGQPKFRTGWPGTAKIWDGTRGKTGQ